MVAKPIAPARPAAPTAPPERIWVDCDPTPSPLRLDFRPALKLLAKLGYAELDVDQWLLEFNQANRDLVGKLELDAAGGLLVSPMLKEEGSQDEVETLTDLGHLDPRTMAEKPTAPGWASACPAASGMPPTPPGFPRSSRLTARRPWRTTGCCPSALPS